MEELQQRDDATVQADGNFDEERARKLEATISKLQKIPVLSTLSTKVIREVDSPDISCKRLAQIVSTDPVIVAEVLKLANSAYFGVRVRVSTVQQATSLLGIDMVSSLVISLALMESPRAYKDIPIFNVERFWGHCMACSHLSAAIARELGAQMVGPGEASLAGLLHDMGIVVLAANEKRKFSRILETHNTRYLKALDAQQPPPTLIEVEEEILGFNHADLGAWLANKWKLPTSISETIRYHHSEVDKCVNKEIVALVQLSDFLCNRDSLDFLPVGADPGPSKETLQFLGKSGQKEFLSQIKTTLQPELERAEQCFSAFANKLEQNEEEEEQELPQAPKRQLEVAGEESQAEENKAWETSQSPVSVDQGPKWTILIPGLDQAFDGSLILGILLLATFLIGSAICVGSFFAGKTGLASLFGVLTVSSWIISFALRSSSKSSSG